MKSIHVACGQLVFRPGDVEHQLGQIDKLAAGAAAAGARLILFAEAALTGYRIVPGEPLCAVEPGGEAVRRLRAISRAHGIVLAVGAFEKAGAGYHVSHFVAYPDGRLLVQHKHSLTPDERGAGIVPGPEERTVFEVDGVRCAISICADSGIPDLWNKLAAQGVQVSLHPCAGGEGREFMCRAADLADPERRALYLKKMEKVCFAGSSMLTSAGHGMAMMSCNLAGDDGAVKYHPGHSILIDGRGCLVALQPGEYVAEFLRPLFIHGELAVGTPRRCP